jgi:superfamily II DNA or RNA helicase
MELRNYQLSALDSIAKEYKAGHRHILVCSPTGSGKGVILSEMIRRASLKGSEVLFLVHRREIVEQVATHLENMLVKNGVIMAGEVHDSRHNVSVATIQTLARRIKQKEFNQADIIVVDEAHHAVSAEYLKVIDYFKKNLVVGFTATPCRKTGLGLGNFFESLIVVETIQNLTDQGFLVPIRYFAPSIPDLKGVKMKAGDYDEKQLGEKMMDGQLVGDVVTNWIKYGEGRQTICFTTTVAHSVAVCEAFRESGIPAEHIDGTTDKEERHDILARYRFGDVRILTNCAVFTEGVDIPDIACVFMARPTKSLALYMQCVGRGMRPAKWKTDMILIDHAGVCYEHGPVHEITDWSLDVTKVAANEKNEERKKANKKPIKCPKCHCVYTKQLKCPSCGNIPTAEQLGKDVEYIDGELGEVCFKTKAVKVKASKLEKEHWHSQLQGYAREKGYKEGWIFHKYRAKFGVKPVGMCTTPSKPGPEVLGWIRNQEIKRRFEQKAAK